MSCNRPPASSGSGGEAALIDALVKVEHTVALAHALELWCGQGGQRGWVHAQQARGEKAGRHHAGCGCRLAAAMPASTTSTMRAVCRPESTLCDSRAATAVPHPKA